MKQAIVVGTGEGRRDWIGNFMKYLPEQYKYPLRIVNSKDFELGVIAEVMNDYDEFIFLHDTFEIKSGDLLRFCFEDCQGKSVSFSNHPSPFGMYAGKYRREILKRITFEIPRNKEEAVEMEITFPNHYAQIEYPFFIPNPLSVSDIFEEKFGRMNMILENQWLKKYKGCWNRSML